MYRKLVLGALSLIISAGTAYADSAGELGRHYGIRFTMPVIIGPLRDLKQGKLPPPAVLSDPERLNEGAAENSEAEGMSTFNPDFDFDEPLYADFSAEGMADLYAMLHKKGSRMSYEIYPLARYPLEEVKLRAKPASRKHAAKTTAEKRRRAKKQ
jgi:hypothetical protein